jgi:FG-GAP-like repeat/Bacterial Ig-like domain (group 3)
MLRPTTIATGILLFSGLLSASITTTTTLTSVTPAAPVFGQAVTMTATVSPATAPGFISFMDRGVLVGSAKLNASGIAQATTLTLSSGPHALVAVYGGNTSGGYSPSQSAALPYIVTAVPGAGFLTPLKFLAGSQPGSLCTADFNGDGKADLAVTNQVSNNVSILLGNGDGTFHPPVNYATGSNPGSVVAGDFNGDGKLDLAVTSDNVSIFLGNGDGSFQTPAATIVGSASVVADFNRDGKADLAGPGGNVLLGNGDGTFQAETASAVKPGEGGPVAVGDFNGDGEPDLVVANYGDGDVSVLLGKGDGTFQPETTFPAGNGPASVAVQDLNGDGLADLVVTSRGDNTISVLLGNGNGTFRAAVAYPAGDTPGDVAVSDFNGDGTPDVVAANYDLNSVNILLGNGDGTFQAAVHYAGSFPGAVVVGDFNRDGVADLALPEGGDPGFVGIMLGVAPAAVTSTTLLSSPNPSPYGQPVTLTAEVKPSNATGQVEFLDGTSVLGAGPLTFGLAQIATSLLPPGLNPLRAVYTGVPGVWQSTESSVVDQVVNPLPASGFAAPVSSSAGSGSDSVAAADFNGDGIVDLAVANYTSDTISILLGNGNGTFQPPLNYTSFVPLSVVAGDFNGDGKADLLIGGYSPSVLLGNGDGTFETGRSVAVGAGAIATADFNGDGKADLAQPGYTPSTGASSVLVMLGNGDGTFYFPQSPSAYSAGTDPVSLAMGDFNHDGYVDMAVANNLSNNVSILFGNGNGSFQAPVNYSTGANPSWVTVADVNGDGNADVLVANANSNNVSVLLGNADGTFQTAVNYAAGSAPTSVVAQDFNGDGKVDVVVANMSSNNVSLLLGNGNGTFQAATSYVSSPQPVALASADFNRDGRGDLAVVGNGGVSILLGSPAPIALQFYPITPCRLVDTRTGQGKTGYFGPPTMAANTSRNFPLLSAGCSLPANAQAYSLNFTVVPDGPLGYLSAWPQGDAYPGVSTLNSSDGSVIANAAIVPAGSGGGITVLPSNATDLIIDVNGYFAPATPSSLEFFPLTPCRIADTRATQPFTGDFGPPSLIANSTRNFSIATSPCVSGSAPAYSLNMTVVPDGTLGFLSVWPQGDAYPGVSTLNSPDGTTLANAAIVPSGSSGGISVLASNATDLIIDINGTFSSATGGLQFYALTPCRVADTRASQPFTEEFGPPSLAANASRNFPIQASPCGIPTTARAYALNMTVVPPGALSFLSVWPQGDAYPGVSTLNSPDGLVVANAAIVPAGSGGGITVLPGNPTDLIIDIVGYFAP